MESRRLAAAEKLLTGLRPAQIARRFGVSRTTACRWQRSIVHSGVESLHKRRATGRPCRLTSVHVEEIRRMYFDGALAHGFAKDHWTTARFAHAIERRFGIRYDPDHVGRLMHKYCLRNT